MRKIKYKLVVSDFDGTLVRKSGEIGEHSKKAINEYVQNGGRFALSSGRMPNSILRRARELGLKGAVGAFQGSVIMDVESGEVFVEGRLDRDLALRACQYLESKNYHIHLYDFDKFYTNNYNEYVQLYEKVTGEKGVLTQNLSQFILQSGFIPYKILIMVHEQDLMGALEDLEEKFGEQCYVTASSRHFVELCNKQYSKGTSVDFFADYYGVLTKETMAIGDQINDLPMLEKAGLGLAVKNCQEKLKDKVTVFEYTNEEDAVGKAIEKYAYED